MSGRSILRITLAGLLAAAFASPAAAQEEGGFRVPLNADPVIPIPLLPEAPMPREKAGVSIEIELSFGDLKVKVSETQTGSFGLGIAAITPPASTHESSGYPCCLGATAIAPAPRDVTRSVCTYNLATLRLLILDEQDELTPGPVMPQPVPPVIAPAPPTAIDHKQLLNFSVGIFGGDEPVMPQPQPLQIVVPPLGPNPAPGCMVGGQIYKPAVIPVVAVPPLTGGPLLPPAPMIVQRRIHNADVIQVVAVDVCPPCPFPQVTPNPLLGTWYRDLGVAMVSVTFTHDEMKLTCTQCDEGKLLTMTVIAHYTTTKDGLVFGAVIGADVDVKSGNKNETATMELAELSLTLQELTDRPFSFRTKMTSAGLVLSRVQAASGEQFRGSELAALGGMYKLAKDGKVPAPTPMKSESSPKIGSYAPVPSLLDTPLPPPGPLVGAVVGPILGNSAGAAIANAAQNPVVPPPTGYQRVGVDFNFTPPVVLAPSDGLGGLIASVACPAPAPRPVNDSMKSMAGEAFGQMLWSSNPFPLAQPLPAPLVQGTVPAGTPTGTYVVLPVGATPFTTSTPVVSVAPLKPSHVGTWFREVGSKQCVVKIEGDHLTITMSEAQEINDKKMIGHLTFTADYSITRDGMTAVGLITNVDVKIDGDLPEDEMLGVIEKVREMQKALEEKPFAMTFRRYGETLVIGNVRMPEIGDGLECQPASYVGGRYSNVTDKPLPRLKVTKLAEPRPMPLPAYNLLPGAYGPGTYSVPPIPLPCPVGPYSMPPGVFSAPALPPTYPGPASLGIPLGLPLGYPQAGLPPVPPIPAASGDLLPPQTLPQTPAPARPVEFVAPAVRPTLPIPTMPEPIPPAVSDNDEPVKPGKKQKKQKYSTDPNVRMQQLLYQSEDLRQMQNEWRRFWFQDQPSHLTPERIHGGIY